MLVILPAFMEIDRMVMVVLSLKSLMTDWEIKLMTMGVHFNSTITVIHYPPTTISS